MVKKGRPRKEFKFDDLPKLLRFAIIKLMSRYGIKDFDEAYEMAGMLLDPNSEEFDKLVNEGAERRYRSRHFTELNKSRQTISNTAHQSGYSRGLNDGTSQNRIWYFCGVCGKRIYIIPNSDSHKAIIEAMREKGWRHSTCHEKRA